MPFVRLYNAPQGTEEITALMEKDRKAAPDVVLVMGTSITIPGIRDFLKDLRRTSSKATFMFVNRTKPPLGMEEVFDYYIAGNVTAWASVLSSALRFEAGSPVTVPPTASQRGLEAENDLVRPASPTRSEAEATSRQVTTVHDTASQSTLEAENDLGQASHSGSVADDGTCHEGKVRTALSLLLSRRCQARSHSGRNAERRSDYRTHHRWSDNQCKANEMGRPSHHARVVLRDG